MFYCFSKLILWIKFKLKFNCLSLRQLRQDVQFALFRECQPRSDLSYNEYIRSQFDPVSKVVQKEESDG